MQTQNQQQTIKNLNLLIDSIILNNSKSDFTLKDYITTIDEFEVHELIAKGGYGDVFLVSYSPIKFKEHDISYEMQRWNKLFNNLGDSKMAIKRIPKKVIMDQPHLTFHLVEREIMLKKSNWLVKAYMTFQDSSFIYFVNEYFPMDLYGLCDNFIGKASLIVCVVAQLVSALEEMHGFGYLHRDIKPENVLIGVDGFIKLCDFGSAGKMVDGLAKSKMPIGTPDYISPEMLKSTGFENFYGEEVDLWSLGVVIYELYTGDTPFFSDSLLETYTKIEKGIVNYEAMKIKEANLLDVEIKKTIQQLLVPKEKRITLQNLKKCKMFESIDWNNRQTMKLKMNINELLSKIGKNTEGSSTTGHQQEHLNQRGTDMKLFRCFMGFHTIWWE